VSVFQPVDGIEKKSRILSLDFSISSTRGCSREGCSYFPPPYSSQLQHTLFFPMREINGDSI
jgi:hypothetical protein